MKLKFKDWNNYLGWAIFLVASIVYLSTIERSLSLWDCGEYIVSSAKLGVTHAPGAAFFQLLGAVWSLFAFGQGDEYALIINASSAIYSAITIMLLFWTITFFVRKLMHGSIDNTKSVNEIILTKPQQIITLGAGLVGASVFMFSDTFWFSAVEGEVYAMASMFTALIIWLGIKWDADADSSRGDKWLVLISLVIGLSIGVHLMVILAIPVVCYLYYARKYTVTIKNFIIGNIITLLVLIFAFKIIFPFTMKLYGKVEIFTVNSLGLPFHSGTFVTTLLLVGLFGFFLKTSRQYKWKTVNTALWCVIFMLVGFTSWLVIPIRANANPHMNLNDPDTALGMLDYFNRVQYGDWPTTYGPVYTAHIASDGIERDSNGDYAFKVTGAEYIKDNRIGKYVKVADRRDYIYNDKYVKFFPKMFDSKAESMENYAAMYGFPEFSLNTSFFTNYEDDEQTKAQKRQYAEKVYNDLITKKVNGQLKVADLKKYNELLNIEPPTFGQQLNYFLDFQINYMFIRYLMWNFSGRQNDLEGHFEAVRGNWVSGIPFIDSMRIGDQTTLPADYKNDGHNVYYMLPLILGLIGFVIQFNRNFVHWWSILALFIITSVGIIFYTSVKPFEPRERDYALVSSFYAFAIWVGIGVYAIFLMIEKLKKQALSSSVAIAISVICMGVPILMGFQNWDDHDRSERSVAHDLAYNYLIGLDKNSILFVYGDNDTYPLWGLQETELFRDDVKIANLTLANSPWNLEQLLRKTYNAEGLPTNLKYSDFQSGTNDNIFVVDGSIKNLFDELNSYLKEGITLEALSQMSIDEAQSKMVDERIDASQILAVYNSLKEVEKYVTQDSMTAKEAIDFILDNKNPAKKALADYFGYPVGAVNFLPVSKIVVPVNKENVLKYGIVSPKQKNQIVDQIEINLNSRTLYKADLMMLSLLANYKWDRAMYFSGGGVYDPSSIFYLQDYLQHAGLSYKFVPIYKKFGEGGVVGSSDVDAMLKTFQLYRWGGLSNPDASFSQNERNYTSSFRNVAIRLAEDLIKEGRNAEAKKVLDKVMKEIPAWPQYNVGSGVSRIASVYAHLGETTKANELFTYAKKNLEANKTYLEKLKQQGISGVLSELTSVKNDLMMVNYNEINGLASAGKKEQAMIKFKELYLPKKLAFLKQYNSFMTDQRIDETEQEIIVKQFNEINELLGLIHDVDTAYAQKEQNELYQTVAPED
ncbi:Protein of uncharacterised function (DUF2723) [Weeksella virosa]|uniref:DUF2723 domain-containing protein n=1 Tax=Weeksella virosa TaxID=1014 RepID=UPI000DFD46DB|nr:DUF2723 domain-containing protein [Weeksella virosa]SUP54429.1 Protein of uncharacterised function (DUF2723) [Weeksella virosa]